MFNTAWTDHLTSALTEAGVTAYIWSIDEDCYQWTGNLGHFLGLAVQDYPKTKNEFSRLLNPGFVPERLCRLHQAMAKAKGGQARPGEVLFTAEFQMRRVDGRQIDVTESVIFQLIDSKPALCGTLIFAGTREQAQGKADVKAADAPVAAIKIPEETLFMHDRAFLAFQPVVEAKNRKVSFYECLIRMQGHNGRTIPAGDFVPHLEKAGQCDAVDMFSMAQAVRELKKYTDLKLSVNVSKRSLEKGDWLRAVVQMLRDYPSVAQRLIVEITETAAIEDFDRVYRAVRTLNDLGSKVALDDFGAGYTSFSQLQQLPVDIVKIDKSYIRNLDKKHNRAFIRTLLYLCEAIGAETVGEGAERFSEAEQLAGEGINYIQGYAFGRPSADRTWLDRNHVNYKAVFATSEFTGVKNGDTPNIKGIAA